MGLVLLAGSRDGAGSSIALQTRRGNDVSNVQDWELLPHKLEAAERVADRCFQQVGQPKRQRRMATGVYNCHGMTFASRRTGVYEDEDIQRVLKDDGYSPVDAADVLVGDVILYHKDGILSHSGIVVDIDEILRVPIILSKWGCGGEYIHHFNVCPYQGNRVTFHREAQDDNQPVF